ncbi:hypothetical protein Tco_0606918 [Tanacetum coccineum]
MSAPPRSRAPRNQAMFGESDGNGGELGGGGDESMCSIFKKVQRDGMTKDRWMEVEEELLEGEMLVISSALGALALEMEALVDVIVVYGGS